MSSRALSRLLPSEHLYIPAKYLTLYRSSLMHIQYHPPNPLPFVNPLPLLLFPLSLRHITISLRESFIPRFPFAPTLPQTRPKQRRSLSPSIIHIRCKTIRKTNQAALLSCTPQHAHPGRKPSVRPVNKKRIAKEQVPREAQPEEWQSRSKEQAQVRPLVSTPQSPRIRFKPFPFSSPLFAFPHLCHPDFAQIERNSGMSSLSTLVYR